MTDRLRFTRRDVLKTGLALGATSLAGCATGPLRTALDRDVAALPGGVTGRVATSFAPVGDARAQCEALVPQVTDLAWLKPGDSVFVKLAVNSGNAHPATTLPAAVPALVAFLRDRGAGKIFVGDQSGVEHVRLTEGSRRSSTRERLESSGLAEAIRASGAELHCFDDAGWGGYFNAKSDFADHWQGALWLPWILEEVDHVVYLPRLSTHALAGYTCGIKLAVGWLRDDSRRELHRRGDAFFDLFTEVNHFEPLRSKVRFALTLATKALLNVGPDIGDACDLGGSLGYASTSLVDHDLFASSLLPYLDGTSTSVYDLYSPYPAHVNYWNRGFVSDTWGAEAAETYRDIAPPVLPVPLAGDAQCGRLALLQGRRPERISLVGAPATLPEGLLAHVRQAADGLFVA